MRTLYTSFLLAAALTTAAPVPYNLLSAWQAAGPQDSGMITFDSLSGGQYPSAVLSGFTFAGVGGNMIVYNPVQPWSNLGNGVSLTSPAGPNTMVITLPTGVYGFGFLIGSSDGSAVSAVINGNTTSPLSIGAPSIPPGPAAFWGIRNDVPIVSIELTAANTMRFTIDNVIWGAQASEPPPPVEETPEASTAILIGSALLLLPTLRRRFFVTSSTSPQLAH